LYRGGTGGKWLLDCFPGAARQTEHGKTFVFARFLLCPSILSPIGDEHDRDPDLHFRHLRDLGKSPYMPGK
jgi:hypothetical protein